MYTLTKVCFGLLIALQWCGATVASQSSADAIDVLERQCERSGGHPKLEERIQTIVSCQDEAHGVLWLCAVLEDDNAGCAFPYDASMWMLQVSAGLQNVDPGSDGARSRTGATIEPVIAIPETEPVEKPTRDEVLTNLADMCAYGDGGLYVEGTQSDGTVIASCSDSETTGTEWECAVLEDGAFVCNWLYKPEPESSIVVAMVVLDDTGEPVADVAKDSPNADFSVVTFLNVHASIADRLGYGEMHCDSLGGEFSLDSIETNSNGQVISATQTCDSPDGVSVTCWEQETSRTCISSGAPPDWVEEPLDTTGDTSGTASEFEPTSDPEGAATAEDEMVEPDPTGVETVTTVPTATETGTIEQTQIPEQTAEPAGTIPAGSDEDTRTTGVADPLTGGDGELLEPEISPTPEPTVVLT